MVGCACPHPPESHAPAESFGQSICLHPGGCDCNGLDEEVIMAAVARSMGKRRVLHDLTDTIRGLFTYQNMAGSTDDFALEIATLVLAKFDVELK